MDPNYDSVDIVFDSGIYSRALRDQPKFDNINLSNVVGFTPLWANIPFTFYVVDQLNNTFTLSVINAADSLYDDVTITLQPGTYNTTTLEYAFKEAIVGASGFPADAPGGVTWAVSQTQFVVYMDPVRTRLRFYHPTQDFKITIANSELAEILGFVPELTYSNGSAVLYRDGLQLIGGVAVKYIEAPYTMNLLGSPVVNVHCSELANLATGLHVTDRAVSAEATVTATQSDIVMCVPINNSYAGIISYIHPVAAINCPNQTLQNATFYLTHGDRATTTKITLPGLQNSDYELQTRVLSLNGSPFQVAIRFYVDTGHTPVGNKAAAAPPQMPGMGGPVKGLTSIMPSR